MKWLLARTHRQNWWKVAGRGRRVYWKWHCWSSVWIIWLLGSGRGVGRSGGRELHLGLDRCDASCTCQAPLDAAVLKIKHQGFLFCSGEIWSCSIAVKFKWNTWLLPAWPHKWAPAKSIRPRCMLSAAGVVAKVSVHVPVVTPHTAGFFKPTNWAWHYSSLLFFHSWSARVGSEWKVYGDPPETTIYTVNRDLAKTDLWTDT